MSRCALGIYPPSPFNLKFNTAIEHPTTQILQVEENTQFQMICEDSLSSFFD